jgi:hypothetical protein
MDPEKFERQMETMLANQTRHDGQIQGLIRVAELQQGNLERLGAGLAELKTEVADSIRESREARRAADERAIRMDERANRMDERANRFDERVDRLVSAIGEWIRQSSARN